jgi:hypothetical protein
MAGSGKAPVHPDFVVTNGATAPSARSPSSNTGGGPGHITIGAHRLRRLHRALCHCHLATLIAPSSPSNQTFAAVKILNANNTRGWDRIDSDASGEPIARINGDTALRQMTTIVRLKHGKALPWQLNILPPIASVSVAGSMILRSKTGAIG